MEKRIKSILPIYLSGIIFSLYCFVFPMYRLADIAIVFGISAIGYFLLNKLFPGKIIELPREITFEKSGNAYADEKIEQGRGFMKRLEALSGSIKHNEINNQISKLLLISEQILSFVAKNPSHSRKINTFIDYYYPTALKFLESYVEFDSRGVRGENIQSAIDKISASLYKIQEAFEHQLDNLYYDKALDITTDIAVLDEIMANEGM